MEPYLYHGIKWYNYNLLIRILQDGYILPRCDLEKGLINDKNNIFNGTKYISLCQKSLGTNDDFVFRSSFNDFIVNKPTLVLENKNINLIYPNCITLFEKDMMSPEEWQKLIYKDDAERVTYFIDELQTKEKISLVDNLRAVGLPLRHLKSNYSKYEIEDLYNQINKILSRKNINVPIVNSSIYDFADNEECIKKYTIKLK